MKKADFDYILQILETHAGWVFGEEHFFIVDRKVYNFIREKGFASAESLIEELRKEEKTKQKTLTWQVVESLVMSDTCFYRDYEVFKKFEDFVLPHIKEINKNSKRLRIWSLGCSSGQEAYSVAMAVKNKFENLQDWKVNIIGSDISTPSIAKAQKSLYSQFEVQMGLNIRAILKNFHVENNLWQVNPDVARMVEFRRYNILEGLTFAEKFDIVFCRNLLRFFDPKSHPQVVEKIHDNQTKDGLLYLGMGEKVAGLDKFYEPVNGLKCLFQVKDMKRETPQKIKGSEENEMPKFTRPESLTVKTTLNKISKGGR